ncbi:MAG: hypothetical protein NTW59_01285 [Candidatus Diapherotrites archaeon]|nr:hypothetical protein [Candidatus Diapherotrites archaeon]
MSLVSLTFGDKRNCFSVLPQIQVTRPSDCIKIDPSIENKVEVLKSCFFYKHNEPYIVANITSGIVAEKMFGEVNGKTFEVTELNSKYGDAGIAKQGMTIGICVKGLENEIIQKGAVILFRQCQEQPPLGVQ